MKKVNGAADIAEVEVTQNGLEVRKTTASLPLSHVSVNNIDALESAEAAPIDLMSNYWSPEIPGELKRVIFDRIDVSPVLAQDTGEVIELECAFFFVKEQGQVKQLRNGSKRLVGALQSYNIQRGTPLEIKYLGKKQNRMNSFKSDNWSVTPLIVNTKGE
jgi:hypothetical protein